MGAKDYKDWPFNRVNGCDCLYCSLTFNEKYKWSKDPSGAVVAGRALKDGEVFYFESKGASVGYVDVPGCFKQAKKNQTLGGWLPSEYTPVEAPIAAMAISTIAPPGGMTCTRCNQNNPYAAPNKRNSAGDEIYVCYSCR